MKNIFMAMLGFILSFFSCKKDEKLTIGKNPYVGQLKTDGYYKEIVEDQVIIYFLYNNGVILFGNKLPLKDLDVQELAYKDGSFYNMAKNLKYYWGVFTVDGDDIIIERWNPTRIPRRVTRSEGKILSDTSFVITRRTQSDRPVVVPEYKVFYFKKFSPKPDSTNSFVK